MKKQKETIDMSFDYLGLDKCKNDEERATKILDDLEKRKVELKQVRKKYYEVLNCVLDNWKKEVKQRFPKLQFKTESPKGGDIIALFIVKGIHYEACIGRITGSTELLCMVRVELDDFCDDKRLEDVVILAFNDVLPNLKPGYSLYKKFGNTDFDNAISCYINIIERIEKLTKVRYS